MGYRLIILLLPLLIIASDFGDIVLTDGITGTPAKVTSDSALTVTIGDTLNVSISDTVNVRISDTLTASISDTLSIRSQDYGVEVTSGRIPGTSCTFKFGANSDVDAGSTPEYIWEGQDIYEFWPDTAEPITISSTSAADDSGSTGAWNCAVYGLDTAWEATSETVVLNGTTPVPLTKKYVRMNRIVIYQVGSGGTNAGDVITVSTVTGDTAAFVAAGDGQTLMCIYSIPGNKVGIVKTAYAGISRAGTGKSAEIRFRARPVVNGIKYCFATKFYLAVNSNAGFFNFTHPIGVRLPPKTDIIGVVETCSAINTGIFAGLEIVLEDY